VAAVTRRFRRIIVRAVRPRRRPSVTLTLQSSDLPPAAYVLISGDTLQVELRGYAMTGTEIKVVSVPVKIQAVFA